MEDVLGGTTLLIICLLPIETSQARVGGVRMKERHPWISWDVMKEVSAKVVNIVASGSSFLM